MVFPVVTDGCGSWTVKNVPKDWCFWTVVLEKTLESPLDCKEIEPVDPEGNQSWIFIGSTDAEAEAPTLWPTDAMSKLIRKTLMQGKIEGRRRMGWDGWMASPPQWTWVWASSGRWWRTRKPGGLQSMGSQRVGNDWATEQQGVCRHACPCSIDSIFIIKGLVKVAQSCLTLCDPMDYTVHGILQARILECVAFPFSWGSSQFRGQTKVSCVAGGFVTSWTTREAHKRIKPSFKISVKAYLK